jgi:hypothetical protein
MTERSQSPVVKGIVFLLGLCGCLVLAWVAVPIIWPSQSNQEIGEGVESSDDGAPDEVSGNATESTPVTSAIAASTSSSSKDALAVEKPPLGQIKILVPTQKFRKEGPNKVLRVDYNDIDVEKVLNTKQLTAELPDKMPDWLKKLNGKRVRMRGYMLPTFQNEGIKRFTLCRDTSACCFGPDPTIYYLIDTTMKSGTSTSYVEAKAVDIEGIFRMEPVFNSSGIIAQFYHLDDAQVVKGGR